jgi:hypothetical protein
VFFGLAPWRLIESPACARVEIQFESIERARGMIAAVEFSADAILALGLGVGLAAACGFRVFVPLLVLGVAARQGYAPLAEGWEWMASMPAIAVFAIATAAEVMAYFVPWLDHALDVIATPAAVAAGMVASASVLTEFTPLMKWTAVVIGGGGAAALVQASTVALRAGSGATTAGLANPVVATAELFGSTATSVLAIVLPVVALIAVGLFVAVVYKLTRRVFGSRVGPNKSRR